MSEGMSSSWKSIASAAASSRISSFKGYLSQQHSIPEAIQRQIGAGKEKAGTFREWAGQKINSRYSQASSGTTEKIALFPGWAARQYRQVRSSGIGREEEPFDVDVFVSGYAAVHRAPEFATRSQRAFIRLAKGFAALPKLEDEVARQEDSETLMAAHLSHSTEELLRTVKLPPRPNDISEDYEVEALERQFQRMSSSRQDSIDSSRPPSRTSSVDLSLKSAPPSIPTTRSSTPVNACQSVTAAVSDELRKMHANLESRLQPFWSSVLSNRTVRISIFVYAQQHHDDDQLAMNTGSVVSRDVVTGPDGSFQARFRLQWEDLCQHPGGLHIAFGDPTEEQEFLVSVELVSPLLPAPNTLVMAGLRDDAAAKPATTIRVPLTYSPVRVISDIDDTIKFSNVNGGARAVFRNIFVKELKDLVIPGMGDWYSGMWRKGVRFHYVSNSPFEILPIIGEFFEISKLPPGSVKLRSYAGKSLFSGLLSAPSARKRAGVLDILEAFPHSKFILIGDSGEQDLELYSDLARENPEQVLGIFIRDTTTGDPLDDPTGAEYEYSASPSSIQAQYPLDTSEAQYCINEQPGMKPTLGRPNTPTFLSIPSSRRTPLNGGSKSSGKGEYFVSPLASEPEPLIEYEGMSSTTTTTSSSSSSTPSSTPSSSGASTPRTMPITPLQSAASAASASSASSSIRSGSGSTSNSVARMTEVERKRYDLQMRVYRARAVVPRYVPLRVFRSPEECGESWTLLSRYFR